MSDNEPQPSNNPFVRFKRHVDSRIGTGLSILTGTSSKTDSATTGASNSALPPPPQPSPPENMDRVPNSNTWLYSSLGGRQETPNVHNTASAQFWHEWAQLSPYSPYNLRHLPRPVPAGVSFQDADLFGFGEAFEDLLAISSGRDLIDLRKRASLKRANFDMFHCDKPPLGWVNRLLTKRLLPQPLPLRHPFEMSSQMALTEALEDRARQVSEIFKALEAHQERLETIEDQKRALQDILPDSQEHKGHVEIIMERMMRELNKNITYHSADVLRQIAEMRKHFEDEQLESSRERGPKELAFSMARQDEEVVTSVDRNLFDLAARLHDGEGPYPSKAKQKTQNQEKPQSQQEAEPDTEEDFFSAIFASLTEVEKSLPTKSLTENTHKKEVRWVKRPAELMENDEDGGKTYTTSGEYVDMFGHVHQKTEVRKVDASGNQTSCETKLIVRPAVVEKVQKSTQERENESSVGCVQNDKYQTSGSSNGKSTGWFWR